MTGFFFFLPFDVKLCEIHFGAASKDFLSEGKVCARHNSTEGAPNHIWDFFSGVAVLSVSFYSHSFPGAINTSQMYSHLHPVVLAYSSRFRLTA